MSDARYPIGEFVRPEALYDHERRPLVDQIARLPEELGKAISGLTDEMLESPYRDGGWSLRQVAHHLADSHINSLCRFKLALTETNPVIRPYDEDRWVRLADSDGSPSAALELLRSVHIKWVAILKSMSSEDFAKTLTHPDSGIWTLDQMLALYAWHGRHHLAHITEARRINHW